MKYIDNLDELNRLVEESEEPIVYPVREEGIIFLDYFRYTNEFYRYSLEFPKFLCIAKEMLPQSYYQRSISGLSVIPLKNLVHFKDTADFFIAAPKEQVDYISNLIKNFGCKNVFVCADEIFRQMKNKIDELEKCGHIRDWHRNYSMKKMDVLEGKLTEQLEVRDTNTKAFEEYRNAFCDKKVVIVGCGPTLKYYKPIEGAIHIGLNYAWKNKIVQLNYLFNTHPRTTGSGDVEMEDIHFGFDKILDKVFVAKLFDHQLGFRHPESISFASDKVVRYFCVHANKDCYLYQNICYHPPLIFASAVFPAFQFALFTHPKEIHLVGCDTTPTGHFYDKNNSVENASNSEMLPGAIKIGYARMKMFAEQYYPDTEIISINPVGLKGLFKDVYTDEFKASIDN